MRRASQLAECAGEGVPRRSPVVAELSYGDQGRQRIAHHRKSQPVKPAPWKRGQLEGKL